MVDSMIVGDGWICQAITKTLIERQGGPDAASES